MRQPTKTQLSDNDLRILQNLLNRYAARYYLVGEDRDRLVRRSLKVIVADPALLLAKPVQQLVAETVHEIYTASN